MSENSMPRHLRNILSQIAQKSKLLKKCNANEKYNDEELEIYKTALGDLIRNTVTYASILTEIKKAYENALKSRDNRINELVTQDRIYGTSANKNQHDDTVKQLIRENEELREVNRNLHLQVAKAGIEMGKLSASHSSDYLSLASEREARYTLFAENRQLHERLRALDGRGLRGDEGGDPVITRIALRKCREALSRTQSELVSVLSSHGGCVPREEHDQLQAERDQLQQRLHALDHQHDLLKALCNKLEASNNSLEEELSDLRDRCGELERAGTPRPHWAQCADYIGGGSDRWWQLSNGLSSREKLRVLLKELGPAAESEHLEFFDGLGSDPSIPPYLRYSGRVRNLRLSRRELAVCVAHIWHCKEQHQDQNMGDYLAHYFEDRYQQPSVRAEWAYNICAAAEQALDDLQVKLFWGALHNVLSERVYWRLRAEHTRLKEQLYREDHNHETVSLEQFSKVCKGVFPLKSEVEVRGLVDAVRRQLKLQLQHTHINLDKLFQERSEGFVRGDLVLELHRQRRAAQQRYLREVVAAIGVRHPDRPVSVEQLKRAFAIVDPAIDHATMNGHLRCAFCIPAGQPVDGAAPAPLAALLARLAAADVQRAGPRSKRRLTRYK